MNIDIKIYNFIEEKMMTTTGAEQKEWIDKYDLFTCRTLFKENKMLDKLEEVEKIRMEVLKCL